MNVAPENMCELRVIEGQFRVPVPGMVAPLLSMP